MSATRVKSKIRIATTPPRSLTASPTFKKPSSRTRRQSATVITRSHSGHSQDEDASATPLRSSPNTRDVTILQSDLQSVSLNLDPGELASSTPPLTIHPYEELGMQTFTDSTYSREYASYPAPYLSGGVDNMNEPSESEDILDILMTDELDLDKAGTKRKNSPDSDNVEKELARVKHKGKSSRGATSILTAAQVLAPLKKSTVKPPGRSVSRPIPLQLPAVGAYGMDGYRGYSHHLPHRGSSDLGSVHVNQRRGGKTRSLLPPLGRPGATQTAPVNPTGRAPTPVSASQGKPTKSTNPAAPPRQRPPPPEDEIRPFSDPDDSDHDDDPPNDPGDGGSDDPDSEDSVDEHGVPSYAQGIQQVGLFDCKDIWHLAFPTCPIFFDFTLARINYGVFTRAPFVPIGVWAARVYASARDRTGRLGATDLDVSAIGEVICPNLPYTLFIQDEKVARKYFRSVVTRLYINPDLVDDTLRAIFALEGPSYGITEEQQATVTSDAPRPLPFEVCYKILIRAAEVYREIYPLIMPRFLTHMFIAFLKRGSVSSNFRERFIAALSTECSIRITVSEDLVRKLFATYGKYLNSRLARDTILLWKEWIPAGALKLTITLNQAEWEGLTCLVTIETALKKYRDFPWARVTNLDPYGGELEAFTEAKLLVKNDAYYGYNNSLGAAVSTNYKNLATVCMKILTEIGGDDGLRTYAGFRKTIPHEVKIDKLIRRYDKEKGSVYLTRESHSHLVSNMNGALKSIYGKLPFTSYRLTSLDVAEED